MGRILQFLAIAWIIIINGLYYHQYIEKFTSIATDGIQRLLR